MLSTILFFSLFRHCCQLQRWLKRLKARETIPAWISCCGKSIIKIIKSIQFVLDTRWKAISLFMWKNEFEKFTYSLNNEHTCDSRTHDGRARVREEITFYRNSLLVSLIKLNAYFHNLLVWVSSNSLTRSRSSFSSHTQLAASLRKWEKNEINKINRRNVKSSEEKKKSQKINFFSHHVYVWEVFLSMLCVVCCLLFV